jgi:hypothetical protein
VTKKRTHKVRALSTVAIATVLIGACTVTADAATARKCFEDEVMVRVVREWDGDRFARSEGYSPNTVIGAAYCIPIDDHAWRTIKARP